MSPDPRGPARRALMADLEERLRGAAPERVRAILEGSSRLYAGSAGGLDAEGALVFDETFLRLLPVIEAADRARLAEILAPHANAPRRTVRRLAFDDEAAVAGPILRASPLVEESDLMLVARERGTAHLLALSQRESLSESVTDLLVGRGGPEVILSTVRNRGARLSNRACAAVLGQAAGEPELRRALQLRPDVPRAQLQRLGDAARATPHPPPDPPRSVARMGDAFRDFLARASRETATLPDLSGALLAVHGVAQGGGLDEARVAGWLRQGERDKAIAAVAYRTRLPLALVQRADASAEPDGFELILCAAGFAYDTFELALMTNPAWRLEQAQVERLVRDFRDLRREEARLAIRLAVKGPRRGPSLRRAG